MSKLESPVIASWLEQARALPLGNRRGPKPNAPSDNEIELAYAYAREEISSDQAREFVTVGNLTQWANKAVFNALRSRRYKLVRIEP
jgi:hypothetical protein